MPDHTVSVDEYLSQRKDFVSSGDVLVKGVAAPASWNDNARSARFVMSSEAEDRAGDIIVQLGIDLRGFLANPAAFFNHRSYGFPIGTWSEVARIADTPARTEGTITFLPEGDSVDADQVAKLVARGALRGASVGIRPKAITRRINEAGEPIRGFHIRESDLIECSVVPIPAHPSAIVKGAGSDTRLAYDAIEYVLDTWVKGADGLIVPREEYEAAQRALKEKAAAEEKAARNHSFTQRMKSFFGLGDAPAGEADPQAELEKAALSVAERIRRRDAAAERAKSLLERQQSAPGAG
ncbi:HK97 family phage prohead protease [Pseudochelatococcus sp. B33]